MILCELSGLNPRTQNEMLYVGMSRARHHLVAIARDQKHVEPGETIRAEVPHTLEGERPCFY